MTQWMKMRKEISEYPETKQQSKIRVAGKVVGKVCKGKKGSDFRACRVNVFACLFDKDATKCTIEIEDAKQEVVEKSGK